MLAEGCMGKPAVVAQERGSSLLHVVSCAPHGGGGGAGRVERMWGTADSFGSTLHWSAGRSGFRAHTVPPPDQV